ncbi:hypothetical protein FSP39_009967 [Pinctada imbricata]|uniref:Phosphatidylinositol-specific phospholipase C X domain-containing protein n=1 Tax=Pinctada imbricata TaxID=66713 RepID=A0AA88Y799_PINIB|nr:hypothetical protein FSP39_009967 [Pinctada imbricata]
MGGRGRKGRKEGVRVGVGRERGGNSITKGPGFWNSTETPDTKYDNWVSLLLDDRSIADLSIPGTHQSVANAGLVWSWCQSLSLEAQLSLGVRFFDIHLRHVDNNLPVYHAKVYQNSNLADVLKPIIEFLNVHTFEVVVMRIKEEVMTKQDDDYETTYNRDVFCKAVNDEIQRFPKERFWFNGDIPSLGDARGKIVLISDFYTDYPLGIPSSNLKVSDEWNVELGEKKWEIVRKHIKEVIAGSRNELCITFTSAKGGLASPGEIANVVNAKLHSFVCGKQERFGIIAMDYPGPQLIRDIIDSNF